MRIQHSVIAAVVIGGFMASSAAGARSPESLRSQNTISVSVPPTAQIGASIKVTVSYTALEDDGGSAVLSVELHPGTSDCVDNPYTTTVSGILVVQGASVTGTGTKVVTSSTSFARPGTYRFCAWLTNVNDDSLLAGPGSADLTLTPAPTEQSWIGHTSQHQRFGLGTYGRTVIGFNYPNTRLICRGTHPSISWVAYSGLAEQLAIKIDPRGHFAARIKQPTSNTLIISGTFSGNSVTGSLTDILHPTLANGITTNTPPERHVTGGVCRATMHFTATHRSH